MGGIIIFFIVIYLFYLDAKTLRREDEQIYRETIKSGPYLWALFGFFIFVVAAPIYYFRRKDFFAGLRLRSLEDTSWQYKNPNFLTITECAALVLTWCFVISLATVGYQGLAFFFTSLRVKLIEFVGLGVLSNLTLTYLIYTAVKKRHGESIPQALGFRKVEGLFLRGLLLPFIIGLVLAGSRFLLFRFDRVPVTPLGGALAGGTPLAILLFLGLAMLIAPFLEEVIYRGYFFSIIRRTKGKLFTVAAISLLFAALHFDQIRGDWMGLGVIFLAGLSVTLLRLWSGSILPGIVAHYSYNILLILIPMVAIYSTNTAYSKYMVMKERLNIAEQERLLSESIENNPDFSPAYNDLAWIYAEQDKNLVEALDLVERALESTPENPHYLDTRAEVLYKLKRYDEAIEIEQWLAEKYPTDKFYKKQLQKYIDAKNTEAGP